MKCPSCGYLAFGPISNCPKCGEPLRETAEETGPPPEDHVLKEDAPDIPTADYADHMEPPEESQAEPVIGPQEAPLPSSPPPEPRSHDNPPGEKRGWAWDEFTPPEMKRPEKDVPPPPPIQASIALRIASGVIDHTFILFLTLGFIILSIVLPGQDLYSLDFIGILPPVVLFVLVIDGVYFILFHGLGASTLGESILGIVLVSSDGQPLTFSRALFRWVSSFGSAALFGLGLLWGWHDKITKTYIARKV